MVLIYHGAFDLGTLMMVPDIRRNNGYVRFR